MATTIRNGALASSLPKCPTGISGLDTITGGGLSRGRPSLVCGTARVRQNAFRHGISRAGRVGSNQFGLANMRERASHMNGRFEIETVLKPGTTIRLHIPIEKQSHAQL